MEYTPAGFGHALRETSKIVGERERQAMQLRARITRDTIVATAAGVRHLGRFTPGWVISRVTGEGRSTLGTVRLRGGFAHLTELGSHHHPAGWEILPKAASKARKRARKRARGPVDISAMSSKGAIGSQATGFGPFAHVHHGPFSPRPFFRAGYEIARPKALGAYDKHIRDSLGSVLK